MSAPPSEAIRVELVESLDRLAAESAAYDALLASAAPGRSFFYRLDTMRAMAPVFAEGRTPFFLLAWHGGQLIGIAPFTLERKPLSRAGVRRLSLWGSDGDVIGVEGELVIRASHVDACVHAFRDALAGPLARRFDVIDLRFFRESSPTLDALRRALVGATWFTEVVRAHQVDLDGTVEQYRATRSHGHMKKIAQLERRLAREHVVELRVTQRLTATERDAIMRLHSARQRELSDKGWQRTAVFADAASRRALEALLELGATAGSARHTLLLADGQLIGFLLAFVEGPTLIAHVTAVDTAFGRFRPGSLLHWAVIQHEFSRGEVSRVELGPGTTQIKQIFATTAYTPQRMRWVPPGALLSRLRCATWTRLVAARSWYDRRRSPAPTSAKNAGDAAPPGSERQST